ncbi:MAG: hypothetical protein H0T76_23380 [Nannocystis sp.]|nr:hypothetical protein [Nannocystis sp.]MBA3549428.1 hypothetical protein [Nannocystis sp.]
MGLHILGLCLSWFVSVHVAVSGQVEQRPAPAEAKRFPSLNHYPTLTPGLSEAIARRDSSGVLRGLADTFAATRWADSAVWERLAYIRIGEPGGVMVNRGGEATRLAADRFDLGCSGALLEALRLLWLPQVELAELAACDPEGGIDCAGDADFGHSMLRHISRKLVSRKLPTPWLAAGTELRRVRLQPRSIDRSLEQADQLQLCTVSHRARKMKGRRYYHHMVVLDPVRDKHARVHLFDTTGRRGVAYRPMRTSALARYLKITLARGNKTFAYVRGTAMLHCLGVTRPDPSPEALTAATAATAATG